MDRPPFIQRFSGVERALHWAYAGAFLLCLATGLALTIPEVRAWHWQNLKVARELHLTAALLLGAAPLVAASWDGFQTARRLARELVTVEPGDGQWLRRWLGRLVGDRRPLPPAGRFNAGQKVSALLFAGLTVGFSVTGLIIWPLQNPLVPAGVRAWVYLAHALLAYAALPLVAGHLFLAAVYPPTRESLRGIVWGVVRRDWALQHHRRWVEASGSTGPAASPAAPSSPADAGR